MELLAGRGIASEPFRAHLNPFEPVQLHEKSVKTRSKRVRSGRQHVVAFLCLWL
jgi:hypothetical protein